MATELVEVVQSASINPRSSTINHHPFSLLNKSSQLFRFESLCLIRLLDNPVLNQKISHPLDGLRSGSYVCVFTNYFLRAVALLISPSIYITAFPVYFLTKFNRANFYEMPPAKPKPSEIAAEAKRTYIPYIEQTMPHLPTRSVVHGELDRLPTGYSGIPSVRGPRIAVIDGDPVDVALDWYEYEVNSPPKSGNVHYDKGTLRIPVINMANEKRAGGDWESGLLAPEENLCRRSNLVHCLTTLWSSSMPTPNYPIPTRGGIYSPNVGECHDRGVQLRRIYLIACIQLCSAQVQIEDTLCGRNSNTYLSFQ